MNIQKIKNVTWTPNGIFDFLNVRPFYPEVSLHSWLLWPTVRRAVATDDFYFLIDQVLDSLSGSFDKKKVENRLNYVPYEIRFAYFKTM